MTAMDARTARAELKQLQATIEAAELRLKQGGWLEAAKGVRELHLRCSTLLIELTR